MSQLKFGSAGVTSTEIDISGKLEAEPVGVPAGIIGTSLRGPAFVPVTVGTLSDWYAKFGETDGKKFGPLAVVEWMRNARSVTYLRVLGVGDGKRRNTTGTNPGSVTSAGFVVGEDQPRSDLDYSLGGNVYANSGSNSVQGRTYFLGAFMSESAGSTVFSSAGLQGQGSITPGLTSSLPIIRGVLMAPSGVILRLSSSAEGSNVAPGSTMVATDSLASGSLIGAVKLLEGGVAKQEFVLLLNGHKGTDPLYPNVITASFDMTAPNYFANVLNSDPLKIQQAGHFLYTHWDIYPATAVVTGSGIVHPVSGAGGTLTAKTGVENCAFLTTASLTRNTSNAYVPNYESFEDRFTHAKSPWVISQRFGGQPVNLFRLHALDAGANVSTDFKISIENIVPSTDPLDQYGSFDLVLREWDDKDNDVKPLEVWRGLSIDPSSDRYIAKVIGDAHVYYDFDRSETAQKLVIEGNYQNKSNYVRVEVSDNVDSQAVDPTALPMGFRGIAHLVTSGSMPMTSPSSTQISVSSVLKRATVPPLPMRSDITQGTGAKQQVNPQFYWGAQFEHVTSLSTPNASTLANESLIAFALQFPDFSTSYQNFVVSDNEGTADSTENGVIDADRFCRNIFTLENIQVVTGSNTLADSTQWASADYVRDGNITSNDTNKTRRLSLGDFTQANRRYLKFSFLMQGGSDGVNIFDNDESQINNAAVVADMDGTNRGRSAGPNVKAFTKALEIMENVVNTDIQLLAIPGIRHPIVTDAAVNSVTERFDAMFVMDVEQLDSNGDNVTSDEQIPNVALTSQQFSDRVVDTSFAAAYFPDIVMTDPTTKTNLFVPPSVQVLGALALNDAVGHPWFAPAGVVRGALPSALEARVKLSKPNMDKLYDVSINPLIAFPGNASSGTNPKGGVTVWGQKTLQKAATSLDRVNVRRLLIDLRRQVREIAYTFIFEQNRETTLARFEDAVRPRLKRVQDLAGVDAFKVQIDLSTTTQQDIDNNIVRGKIWIKPKKAIEYVSIDFVVGNSATVI